MCDKVRSIIKQIRPKVSCNISETGMPKTLVFVKELKNGEQINKEAKDFLESLRQKGIEPESFSEYKQLKMVILKVIDRYFTTLSITERNEHLYVRGKKLNL